MDYLGDVVTSQTLLLLNELRVAKTRSRKKNLAVDLEGCGGSQALVEVPKASTKMTTIVWSGNESKRKWCNNAKVREL
jgi:hypothetical protein